MKLSLFLVLGWGSTATEALLAPVRTVKRVKEVKAVPTGTVWAISTIAIGAAPTPIVARAIKRWYAKRLVKPKWTPPDRIFAPTWTILYGLIGLAAGRVASISGTSSTAMVWAYSHFALNLIWAPVFFGLKLLKLGALLNMALLASLFVVISKFKAIDPVSPYLFAPYLLWLSFATLLNIEICRLNPKGVPASLRDRRKPKDSAGAISEDRAILITPPPPAPSS